ncbi:hypothetical protein MP228_010922 [Amoeboaphelidium protococcarum]|nr:hypothetical protein MP228_010922 [Amoeboaphelidium protococcarum]
MNIATIVKQCSTELSDAEFKQAVAKSSEYMRILKRNIDGSSLSGVSLAPVSVSLALKDLNFNYNQQALVKSCGLSSKDFMEQIQSSLAIIKNSGSMKLDGGEKARDRDIYHELSIKYGCSPLLNTFQKFHQLVMDSVYTSRHAEVKLQTSLFIANFLLVCDAIKFKVKVKELCDGQQVTTKEVNSIKGKLMEQQPIKMFLSHLDAKEFETLLASARTQPKRSIQAEGAEKSQDAINPSLQPSDKKARVYQTGMVSMVPDYEVLAAQYSEWVMNIQRIIALSTDVKVKHPKSTQKATLTKRSRI